MTFHLDAFTLPPFLAFIFNLSLAGIALHQNRKPLHLLFACWNILLAAWNAVSFLLYNASSPEQAMAVTRNLRDFFLFIHPLFLHFVMVLLGERSRRYRVFLGAVYALSGVFVLANHADPWFVQGMKETYWGYIPVPGPLAKLYAFVFQVAVWTAIYRLYGAMHTATGMLRNQSRFLFWAAVLLFGGSVSNFLVVLGVAIYPFGNVFNILSCLLVAYAVIGFGFLDFRMLVGRSVAYSALACAVTGTYVLIEALIGKILEKDAASPAYLVQMAAVPLTLVAAARARHLLNPFMDKIPAWRRHDISGVVRDFHENVLTLGDLKSLAKGITTHLQAVFKAEDAALFVRSMDHEPLTFCAGAGQGRSPDFPASDALIEWVKSHASPLLRDQWLWRQAQRPVNAVSSETVARVRAQPWAVLVPLKWRHDLVGMIGLGAKITGDMYHAEDIRLLNALSGLIAMAISNARALQRVEDQRQKIDRQRESAMMGTLVTELAHELGKPLTHIVNEGARLESGSFSSYKESLAKIEKEARRASEIVNSFGHLSSDQPLGSRSLSLADLLEEALQILGVAEDPAIRIERHVMPLPLVDVHPVLMVQVLTNVFQNAVEAIATGGLLRVELGVSDQKPVMAQIRISDNGPGIAPDLLSRVFDPFVTTKQQQGGRGVGLSISRAMVERHGGTISVESPTSGGPGTCVTICLPFHQET